MATLGLAFCKVNNVQNGVSAIASRTGAESESITTSSSSQSSTNLANSSEVVARVAVSGGDVWVTFGATPTASAGTTFFMIDGSVEYFAVNEGDKLAVIDAA